MVQVKVCGLMDTEAVETAVAAGADFIGFVFADSKRQITKKQASDLAQKIPAHVKKVGVFVNETAEEIRKTAESVGLDYIQLHGDEPPAFCEKLGLPVIKAFQVRDAGDLEKLAAYDCDYYLLDSPAGKYRGGSGETFDWSLVKEYAFLNKKIILAGGLRADNINKAIHEVHPVGVDVSSGVETDSKKDPSKIKAFLHAAKKGDNNGNI